jgi:hypothetical protein
MKLINFDEDIPDEFYVFINLQNFLTKHNYENSKSFTSAAFGSLFMGESFIAKYLNGEIDYLPYTPNSNNDLNVVSPFRSSITAQYTTEYNVELSRKYNFPLFPSRLSAIYAFGDYNSCIEVNRKYGWDLSLVKRFKILEHPLVRVAKVNMEIISLERYASKISMLDQATCDHIWIHYWTGKDNMQMELPTLDSKRENYNSGIIWEYLIEGTIKEIE